MNLPFATCAFALFFISFVAFVVQAHGNDNITTHEHDADHDHAHHHDCGNPDSTPEEMNRARQNEIEMFGISVAEMNFNDLTNVVASAAATKVNGTVLGQPMGGGSGLRRKLQAQGAYTLIGLPMVYHVLINQGSGNVAANDAQLEHVTSITNTLYNIYDKSTQTSVQWATFKTDKIIRHEDRISGDCGDISRDTRREIVRRVPDWEFKVCKPNLFLSNIV